MSSSELYKEDNAEGIHIRHHQEFLFAASTIAAYSLLMVEAHGEDEQPPCSSLFHECGDHLHWTSWAAEETNRDDEDCRKRGLTDICKADELVGAVACSGRYCGSIRIGC